MKKKKSPTALLTALFLLSSTLLIASAIPAQKESFKAPQEPTVDPALPVTDYEAPESVDPLEKAKRRAKNKRYDRQSSEVIKEAPYPLEGIWSTYWWKDLPAIPVKQSDVILIGDVINAQAYLSADKTGVYSEFIINAKEILKGIAVVDKYPISAERFGGAVRFPSGVIQKYRTHAQRMPRLGQRYLFFLKRLDQTDGFSILTGYEVGGSTIVPLDGASRQDGEHLPFESYRGADVSSFLKLVRDSVSHTTAIR